MNENIDMLGTLRDIFEKKGVKLDGDKEIVMNHYNHDTNDEVSFDELPNEIKFNKDKIIHNRLARDGGKYIECFLRDKLIGVHDTWFYHYDDLAAHAEKYDSQEFCEWFIGYSFKAEVPSIRVDLKLLKDGSIVVTEGNHRIAMLQWLGYEGTLNKKYFMKNY